MDDDNKMNVSIVIPACNEEKTLAQNLESYERYLSHVVPGRYELIIICNGCTDNTPQIAMEYQQKFTQIQAVNFPERIGKGAAIKKGFYVAKGDIIAFVDADGAIYPEEFWMLVQQIGNGNDGAIGSRYLPGARILKNRPLKWRLVSRAFNLLVRILFGLPFRDTQCGVKVFKRQVVRSVIDSLSINGMTFDVELLWKIKNQGFRIVELPITWEHKPKNGPTNDLPRTVTRMALDITRLRLKSLKGSI